MKDVFRLGRDGFNRLTIRGKWAIGVYSIALLIFGSLDALGLLLLADALSSSSMETGSNIAIEQHWIQIVVALALFVIRSAVSVFISWLGVLEFARQETMIANENYQIIQNEPWSVRSARDLTDSLFAIDEGPTALVNGLILKLCTLGVEVSTAVIIISVTIYINPTVALTVFVYLAAMGVLQHRLFSNSSSRIGRIVVNQMASTKKLITEGHQLSKLLSVMPSKSYSTVLGDERGILSLARAKIDFVRAVPRAFLEASLVVGVLLIGFVSYSVSGLSTVIPSLVLFAVIGFRLLPIANQIQVLSFSLLSNVPMARIGLCAKDGTTPLLENTETLLNFENNPAEDYLLCLEHVTFTYSNAGVAAVQDASVKFKPGLIYALVGPTGSGKTTFADLCLGLLTPQSGSIFWARGHEPILGYVPQETFVFNSSLKKNVAIEWHEDFVSNEIFMDVVRASNLTNVLNHGIEGLRVDDSTQLSGGQKQLIGLARALYRSPDFLILDEATSSLDNATEQIIMDTVRRLQGKVTVLVIAHRLSTIRTADQIIYIRDGTILGIGTFIELQQQIPDFELQVRLGAIN